MMDDFEKLCETALVNMPTPVSILTVFGNGAWKSSLNEQMLHRQPATPLPAPEP
jgi:hypothetical protein